MKSNDDYLLKFESEKDKLKLKIHSIITKDFLTDFQKISPLLSDTINDITTNIISNVEKWINDDIPLKYKKLIFDYIDKEKWIEIINSFYQELNFGTSGIRGKLTFSLTEINSEKDLHLLQKNGFNSTILRGSNSFNEITLMRHTYGLLTYMKKNNLSKIVIGYDSRVHSRHLAHLVAKIFLKYNFAVYLFDNIVPLPELSFAVTTLKAGMGIEITASHNDKRYNGYKLITKSGSPPSQEIRNEISDEIFQNNFKIDSTLLNSNYEFISDNTEQLKYLGDKYLSPKIKSDHFIEFHQKHIEQITSMIFQPELLRKNVSNIKIGYSAMHGTGYTLASKLLKTLGFHDVKYISSTTSPDYFFPSFHLTQMLDPSDSNAAKVIVKEFVEQYGTTEFKNLDILCFTDPDADRLGIIVNVPTIEQCIYGEWKLLKANDVWTLFLWYMLEIVSKSSNFISPISKMFIVKNFVTSDALNYISQKYGIDCIDGKVGFSDLTTIVQKYWKDGKINIGMFEESCGFGLAGNISYPQLKSHILEKDGILTLALITEIVAYAKSINSDIWNLLNKIYLDPEIGFFATFRTELPENGIYEGIKDEFHKKRILKFVEKFYDDAKKKSKTNEPILVANLPILDTKKYSTGKYDSKYWKNFPDEGIRFFLDSKDNHITIRSSGTEPKIRIFVQYRITNINNENLLQKKIQCENLVKKIADEIISLLIDIN